MSNEDTRQTSSYMKSLLGQKVPARLIVDNKEPLDLVGTIYYHPQDLESQDIGIINEYVQVRPHIKKPGFYLVIEERGAKKRLHLPLRSIVKRNGGLEVTLKRNVLNKNKEAETN